ncbi:sigma-54-dependent Fis family transcriptional regulator [Microbulbifer salipaludis]|uniref:Sigma-54-dependent Fis family transcriptional regulator n=1 Tax=Microbulbifer salipaludis TaxID=187980 RepID=A0ABS3E4X3_9GAMM|nr:sigma-54 dependent transcriptional regulator [Microbulbifer salipaludis]MBN8430350.1 sigma-54-dependent Fis family transcriptional regulator [Microbulbifer salipaludis]
MTDRQPIALVVDDEPDICDLISMTLRRMHVRADIAMSVAEARRRIAEKSYDFCLTDMRLPDGDGLELVEAIQDLPKDRSYPVAVITAHGNMDTAITALKLGAFDFVSKPVNLERLRALVLLALRLGEDRFFQTQEFPPLLQGQSSAVRTLRDTIEKVARSDAPVHLQGPPGSGKELTARCIHDLGPRAEQSFVVVHCSTIPRDAFEQTLFGSNTAGNENPGLLQAANGGTLFLDEITALPKEVQVKLLQVIEEKRFHAIGDHQPQALNIRLISSAETSLAAATRNGDFRSDLFFRINVIELAVPALRERQEDIPLLARYLLRRITEGSPGAAPRASQDAVTALQAYPFPGNLRELENILERALTLCESNTISADDLILTGEPPLSQAEDNAPQPGISLTPQPDANYPGQFDAADYNTLDDFLQTIERDAIESALNETRGNKTAAAEKLGISFRSLRYRLKKLGLESE